MRQLNKCVEEILSPVANILPEHRVSFNCNTYRCHPALVSYYSDISEREDKSITKSGKNTRIPCVQHEGTIEGQDDLILEVLQQK